MKKKKWLIIVIIAIIAIAAIGSSQGDSSVEVDPDTDIENGTVVNSDYDVKVSSYKLSEDLTGDPVIIITYEFTNNSDDEASFLLSIDDSVYQAGVSLSKNYFVSDDDYNSTSATQEIKSGVTYSVDVAYTLNDSSTTVEIEIKEFSIFDEDIFYTAEIEL